MSNLPKIPEREWHHYTQDPPDQPAEHLPTASDQQFIEYCSLELIQSGSELSAFDRVLCDVGSGDESPAVITTPTEVFAFDETIDSLSPCLDDQARFGTGQPNLWLEQLPVASSQPHSPPSRPSAPLLTLPQHLDALVCPSDQLKLIHHWTVYLCDAIIPIPSPDNPFRTVLLPLSLHDTQAASDTPSARSALFHAICGASASHLVLHEKEDSVKTRNLAFKHVNQSLKHLRQCLTVLDENEVLAVMATLAMSLTIQAITGAPSTWRVHVEGACRWLKQIPPEYLVGSTSAHIIHQLLLSMLVLAQSRVDDPNQEASHEIFRCEQIRDHYMLDRLFGIPYSVLSTIAMGNHQHQGAKNKDSRDLHLAEIELYVSAPTESTYQHLGSAQRTMTYHMNSLSHCAGLIYFKRSARDTPVQGVQDLVEQAIDHMEILETTTNKPFAPIVWPIAMIAFEAMDASLQWRIQQWLDSPTRGRLSIWQSIRKSASKVWTIRGRSEGMRNVSWQDILRYETDFDIVYV